VYQRAVNAPPAAPFEPLVDSRRLLVLTLAAGALTLAASALVGCHGKTAEPALAAGDSGAVAVDAGPPFRVDSRAVDFGVYLATVVPPAVLTGMQDDARKKFPGLAVFKEPKETRTPGVFVFAPNVAGFPPPSVEQLGYIGRGLDDAAAKKAAASKGVVILAWKLNGDPKLAHLRDAQRFVLDAAQKNGGFVWDETTRQLYTTDAWQKARIDTWDGELPDMRRDLTIHYYETDTGHHRAITLGMEKFGFPDIVVADVVPNAAGPMTSLMDVAAQLLVEGATVGANGALTLDLEAIHHKAAKAGFVAAAGKAATVSGIVTLVPRTPEKGDPPNRLVEMKFDSFQGNTVVVRQASALTAILGTHAGAKAGAPADDAEMAKVVSDAQAKLPDVANRFRAGLPKGEHLVVEAQFDTDEGREEWLWIGVSSWPDDVAHGALLKDATGISALRHGTKVEAGMNEIVDYMVIGPDGRTIEGGGTESVLRRRTPVPPSAPIGP
jgi:hypothetical protein